MNKASASQLGAADVRSRAKLVNPARFGPWAVVTGASAGIGKEFARQLAAHGMNLVLVARRLPELERLASGDLSREHGIECRCVQADLATAEGLGALFSATRDLDVGLVVSNAGEAAPGEFLRATQEEHHAIVRINVLSHLDIAHHFGRRLAARKSGGLILVGALGASDGVPFMANPAATKAYVYSLGQALHAELAKAGVTVTVLTPGPTATAAFDRIGIENPPMKPMTADQCVTEALRALNAGRASIIPGRLLRLMKSLVPASVARDQTAKMFEAAVRRRPAPAPTTAGKPS